MIHLEEKQAAIFPALSEHHFLFHNLNRFRQKAVCPVFYQIILILKHTSKKILEIKHRKSRTK